MTFLCFDIILSLTYFFCKEVVYLKKTRNFERSKHYRSDYFKRHKGLFNLGIYHCAYCGKILTKKGLEVDHLIPVNKVKFWGVGRLLMRLSGISDINDRKNLVASCKKCNSQKRDRLGVWVIQGFFGRFWTIWFLKLFIAMFLLSLFISTYGNKIQQIATYLFTTFLHALLSLF